VNERLKYEQTISSKLGALPLPDMADAIWSRIETQLDIDMPTDDGGGNNSGPDSPMPRIIIGGSVFIIIIAFIAFFLNPKNNKQEQPQIQNTTSPSTPAEQVVKPPGEKKSNNAGPLNDPKQQNNSLPVVFDNATDSTVADPFFGLTDSNRVQPNLTVQNPLPDLPKTVDSVQQGKKKRGVSGITDNDYRIVPKKDSSK
jgi:hypothetical protein